MRAIKELVVSQFLRRAIEEVANSMINLQHASRLVLGMRSTTPLADACVAFAKASKRLKQAEAPPFEITDLTTALSRLESQSADSLRFEFLVPANHMIFHEESSLLAEESLSIEALSKSIDLLLNWEFDEARAQAKDVLRTSRNEEVRDEALNVVAASFALTGEIESAIAALKQAVEGEWSYTLQQNLGVLAIQHSPALAAEQATYWLDASDTREDRERAIFLVLSMWMDMEQEDNFELSPKIRASFRQALQEDLLSETFSLLGNFLARHDSEWIADGANWVDSPHFGSDAAAMVLARAEGLESYVEFLIENASTTDPAIMSALNNFIGQVIDALIEDENIGPALHAIELIDKELPCNSFNTAFLRLISIQRICQYSRAHGGEPREQFQGWLAEVQNYISTIDDPAMIEVLTDSLERATTLLVLAFIIARDWEFEQFSQPLFTVHGMAQRWGSRRQLNKAEVHRLLSDVIQWCTSIEDTLNRFDGLPVLDDQVNEFKNNMFIKQREVKRMALEVRGKI